ncbi:5'-nucleotidase SurE 1 [Chlorella vulgaris]
MTKPRLLISNDDGITTPGLRALTAALHQDGFCTFAVSAPAGERSAQSHCISIGKSLHAWSLDVEGAEEAYAVDGTPADSVMIALYGPLLVSPSFQLVVSGINRGDNCGLHVIYSGTVGAAREAACKDVPSIAVSLDNYLARTEDQYAAAATYTVALCKAVLGILPPPGGGRHAFGASHLSGHVVNELEADAEVQAGHVGAVALRVFRNAAGSLRGDLSEGCDSWAVGQGWVSVTPICLRSDMPLTAAAAAQREQQQVLLTLAAAMQAAARSLGAKVAGLPRHLEAAVTADPASIAAGGGPVGDLADGAASTAHQ